MRTRTLIIAVLSCVLFSAIQSWAATYLPDPTTKVGTKDTPVAILYEDFYSYSAYVLGDLYDTTIYSGSVGTGVNDLVLWSGPAVKNEDMGDDDSLDFNPSVSENTGDTKDKDGNASGTWIAPVDLLYTYLMQVYNTDIPVFVYDFNQDQSHTTLQSWGSVSIRDASGSLVDNDYQWLFGTEQSKVEVPLEIPYYDEDGVLQSAPSSKGGGKGDFYLLADPSLADPLKLGLYKDQGWYLYVNMNFNYLNNGFEEIFLTGALQPSTAVPEPSSLFLLGFGVSMLVFIRRKY